MNIVDPFDEYQYNRKLKKMKVLIEKYQSLFDSIEVRIEGLENTKTKALKILKQVEEYVNSLAHSPKEYQGLFFSPNVSEHDYKKEYEEIKNQNKKIDNGTTVTALLGGTAALLGGPVCWAVGLTTMVGAGIKKKKENESSIEKIDGQIRSLEKEIQRLENAIPDTMTNKDFLQLSTEQLEGMLEKIKDNKLSDYNKFSAEQKSDLASLVNLAQALAKRMDSRQ